MNGKWLVWRSRGGDGSWYVIDPGDHLHSTHETWHSAYGVAYFLSHYR